MSIIRSALSKVAASSTLESVGKPAWVQMWVRKGSTHAVGAAPIEKIAIFDPHLELPTLSTVVALPGLWHLSAVFRLRPAMSEERGTETLTAPAALFALGEMRRALKMQHLWLCCLPGTPFLLLAPFFLFRTCTAATPRRATCSFHRTLACSKRIGRS